MTISNQLSLAKNTVSSFSVSKDMLQSENSVFYLSDSSLTIWSFWVGRAIGEIYDRIVALESKGSALTRKDKLELEKKLAALFDWAKQVSKQIGIPLPKL